MTNRQVAMFWMRVERTASCWLWKGRLDREGYGIPKIDGKTPRAHRVAWELLIGELDDGREIHHECRVRNCVNPDHLRAVTPEDHRLEGYWRNRPACKNGHEFTPDNTYWVDNARRCRACRREAVRAYKQRKATRLLPLGEHREIPGTGHRPPDADAPR